MAPAVADPHATWPLATPCALRWPLLVADSDSRRARRSVMGRVAPEVRHRGRRSSAVLFPSEPPPPIPAPPHPRRVHPVPHRGRAPACRASWFRAAAAPSLCGMRCPLSPCGAPIPRPPRGIGSAGAFIRAPFLRFHRGERGRRGNAARNAATLLRAGPPGPDSCRTRTGPPEYAGARVRALRRPRRTHPPPPTHPRHRSRTTVEGLSFDRVGGWMGAPPHTPPHERGRQSCRAR
jgi:hypothetical protein